jgi:hypothetical protein
MSGILLFCNVIIKSSVLKISCVQRRERFFSLARFNSLEPGNVTCDFEESSGCEYAFGSHFVWREGYIHHLPSIDHTIGNESGMYIEIYNIGVLTVNIEFMWQGLEMEER